MKFAPSSGSSILSPVGQISLSGPWMGSPLSTWSATRASGPVGVPLSRCHRFLRQRALGLGAVGAGVPLRP
eukprot:2292028-Pyramimonas_sp.AAC.1